MGLTLKTIYAKRKSYRPTVYTHEIYRKITSIHARRHFTCNDMFMRCNDMYTINQVILCHKRYND